MSVYTQLYYCISLFSCNFFLSLTTYFIIIILSYEGGRWKALIMEKAKHKSLHLYRTYSLCLCSLIISAVVKFCCAIGSHLNPSLHDSNQTIVQPPIKTTIILANYNGKMWPQLYDDDDDSFPDSLR